MLLPGKNIRWDPANPTWDPMCVPGGIPPFSGGIPGGIMEKQLKKLDYVCSPSLTSLKNFPKLLL